MYGFAPVVGGAPKVLVLGTFPGLASREAEEYYAHPRNQFWRILYGILGEAYDAPSYRRKLQKLKEHGIALWDMVASCETTGSADTEIQNPVLIDLPGFLRKNPSIQTVCFNGGNAARFAKKLGRLAVDSAVLPSTSPANARYSLQQKEDAWRRVLAPALNYIELKYGGNKNANDEV